MQDEGTALTWIGHSTFWIQLNRLQILTDPVWSTRIQTSRRLQLDRSQLQILPIGGTVSTKNRNEYQEPEWVKDLWQTVESSLLPEAESQQ